MPTETRPTVSLRVDGQTIEAEAGSSLASAMLGAGITRFRRSVNGEPRAPLCGMGICYECRVNVDGRPHRKACQVVVAPNMDVQTDA